MTLEEIEALTEQLSLKDLQKLHAVINERMKRAAQADAILQLCRENAVRTNISMDSGEEMRQMREERGEQLL